MSSMTYTALSDCSYPDSEHEDVKSQIANVFERLMAVIQEQAALQQLLKELFDKQDSDALEELKKANKNLETVREERKRMERQTMGEAPISIDIPNLPFAKNTVDDDESENLPPVDERVNGIAVEGTPDTIYGGNLADNGNEGAISKTVKLIQRARRRIAQIEVERRRYAEDQKRHKAEYAYWNNLSQNPEEEDESDSHRWKAYCANNELVKVTRSLEAVQTEYMTSKDLIERLTDTVPSAFRSELEPDNTTSPAHFSITEDAVDGDKEPTLSGDQKLIRKLNTEITDLERERKKLLEDETNYRNEKSCWEKIQADICKCKQNYSCRCGGRRTDAWNAAERKLRAVSDPLADTQFRLKEINGVHEVCSKLLADLVTKVEAEKHAETIPSDEPAVVGDISVTRTPLSPS